MLLQRVVNDAIVVTRDSSNGTGLDRDSDIRHSVNRSMDNDVKRNSHGICQETSEQNISKQEMVADDKETESDGNLSEVMEEIIDLDDGKDAGLVTQYDSSG